MANRARTRTTDYRWLFTGGTAGLFSAQGAGSVAATFFTAGTIAETIRRLRGEVMVWVDGLEAPAVSATIGMGLIKAQSGQGATVLSSPITDGDAPWIWVDYMTIGYEEMVVDAVDVPMLSAKRVIVDNKSMRRFRPDQEVQFVVENVTLAGALSVNVAANIRALISQ